jgi:hypothetical protein
MDMDMRMGMMTGMIVIYSDMISATWCRGVSFWDCFFTGTNFTHGVWEMRLEPVLPILVDPSNVQNRIKSMSPRKKKNNQ